MILIDYGHDARELYSVTHSDGTLTTFSRHTMSGPERGTANPAWLQRPGEQDIAPPVPPLAARHVDESLARPALAHQRQFPAVDWEVSYSLQAAAVAPWFAEHVGADWSACRARTLELLQRERELRDIAALVGPEALQDADRLLLDVARLVRESVLGQSAYDPNDAASPLEKTYALVRQADALYRASVAALESGAAYESLDLGPARRALAALRRAGPDEWSACVAAAEDAVRRIGGPPGEERTAPRSPLPEQSTAPRSALPEHAA